MRISNQALAGSVLSTGIYQFLSVAACGDASGKAVLPLNDIEYALSWASIVTLLGAFYYFHFLTCRHCVKGKRRARAAPEHVAAYRDLPGIDREDPNGSGAFRADRDGDGEAESENEGESRPSRASAVALPPAMSPFYVLVYAYGWGLVFFVAIYCLAGVYVPGANWWILGCLALSIDELLVGTAGKPWLALILLFVVTSSVFVWWGVAGQYELDLSVAEIVIGIVAPAVSPFMLCFLRFNPRLLLFNEIQDLFKVALPFMVVLSACILVIQGVHRTSEYLDYVKTNSKYDSGTRSLFESPTQNHSGHQQYYDFIATHAPFGNETEMQKLAENSLLLLQDAGRATEAYYAPGKLLAVLLAPVAVWFTLDNIMLTVIENCATELVVGVTLCTAVRFGISREYDWVSAMAVSASGLAFVLIVLFRRTY